MQRVAGSGFAFDAPAGWTVERKEGLVAAEDGRVDRVEVRTFELVRPYRPQLFGATRKELDSAAQRIAKQLSGRLTSRRTIGVAGRKGRMYRIEFEGQVEEIAFVLHDRREYQLLCRRDGDGDDVACRRLFESFALG